MDWEFLNHTPKQYNDVAQICLNGHLINSGSLTYPGDNQKFCRDCGEETITNCKYCNKSIRGDQFIDGISLLNEYTVPKYCEECGKEYPWTTRKLAAAKELADEFDNISDEEKEILKNSLDDIVKNGPKTTVATTRFKKIVSKVGPEGATGMKEIIFDVVSEAVKKMIWS